MRHHAPRIVTAVLIATLLAACAPEAPDPSDGPVAVASPIPSPPVESPSASASPSPSPSPDSDPSPEPSPSASPGADPDQDAALAAARAHRAGRGDCDDGMADDLHRVVATVDGRMLVLVVCFLGAYQANGELLVWDGASLTPITVEQWQPGGVVDSSEVVGDVTAVGDGTTVVNEYRYRGLGDCGVVHEWVFDGASLVLDLAREQECADDGEYVPPEEWPVVYER